MRAGSAPENRLRSRAAHALLSHGRSCSVLRRYHRVPVKMIASLFIVRIAAYLSPPPLLLLVKPTQNFPAKNRVFDTSTTNLVILVL